MSQRKGGLGSGFGALLRDNARGGVRDVLIDAIQRNPRQPRTRFDDGALDELAASIREHGVIQPLIVSERDDGGYLLIAGERRWLAARRAGRETVPVVVREATPQQLLELAIIENVQRADLSPIEEAQAYQSLKDDFNLSDDEIARRVGRNNRVTITNTRRLLKLPPPAQEAIQNGAISAGHGRALLRLDAPDQQLAALQAVLEHGLNVREAERLGELAAAMGGDVAGALAAIRGRPAAPAAPAGQPAPRPAPRPRPAAGLSADDQELARELERTLGTPVALARTERELRLTITFYDDEQLQEFLERLA
jgi:ParB family chromosome partitioning protein